MITIAAAYVDLMNLYGDYANIVVLQKRLACAGHAVTVKRFSVNEPFDLSDCDALYIGAGTEPAMLAALKDIGHHADAVAAFVARGGKALFTGNAAALVANTITLPDNTVVNGLALADYDVTIGTKRRYAEYIMHTTYTNMTIIGAINTSLELTASQSSAHTVDCATANAGIGNVEGYYHGGIYATQLGGPVLVRNPELLEITAAQLCGSPLAPCEEPWLIHLRHGHRNARAALDNARGPRR